MTILFDDSSLQPELAKLIERLEYYYDFICKGGPLRNCIDWLRLKELLLSVAQQGPSRRPSVRCRVQGVRQYLLAHSFNYEVDVTHHNTDAYQVPKLVSKKLRIVPERVAFEEVQEQVMRGLTRSTAR